ncbi:MAG: putative quinol monooxygenase [Pseudomonas prosekii]|jgi:quinol monooxygenase YgiN|uniref:Antibiotic biosynthesis monooxygenase n=1 Tax=Pseudomonas prosekii TaxID=1148509 RepID=A0A3L8CM37_9PSED|nr:putative quinol monooxygenase [Pseudomonas prosekii]RLU06036.1 antibiotic biosynthesis monooxygenase [Pseudomonas prosekii]RLU08849.1 antibiotic biosynthesis monooxygenase [Pseudomonas prosekii]
MSQPFTAIATLIAKPGQQDALEQHLRALLAPTRVEAGCGQYDLHQDLANPLAFYMIEQWSSDEALQAHDASAHVQNFRAKAADFLEHFELKRLRTLS